MMETFHLKLSAPYFYPTTGAFTRNRTPEAAAFFASAISEQNFAFARSSLASCAGDQHCWAPPMSTRCPLHTKKYKKALPQRLNKLSYLQ